jgi:hypothetical protein
MPGCVWEISSSEEDDLPFEESYDSDDDLCKSLENSLNVDEQCDSESKPIYSNSNVTCYEFCLVFLFICNQLKLNISSRNVLLEFIKTILPPDNLIPASYYK